MVWGWDGSACVGGTAATGVDVHASHGRDVSHGTTRGVVPREGHGKRGTWKTSASASHEPRCGGSIHTDVYGAVCVSAGRTRRARAQHATTLGRDRRRRDDAERSDGSGHLCCWRRVVLCRSRCAIGGEGVRKKRGGWKTTTWPNLGRERGVPQGRNGPIKKRGAGFGQICFLAKNAREYAHSPRTAARAPRRCGLWPSRGRIAGMPMSPSSPRGFHSAEADEAVREAARAEARRYRNSNNGNGFPRGEIPGGGCAAGAQWSAFSGTCVGNVHGAHRVSGDMPSPALVTTCIAVAAAAVIFVVVLWVFFVSTRALARRLRRAANGRKDGYTIWMAFRNAVIDTLVARFTESAVESMDAKTGVTTRQADQKKGDSGNGKTAKTQGASREEPEKAETAPSGVCLGTAMGAVVAGLARFAPDTIGETEAIAAAREMAAALTLYLEPGAGGAGAFRESFVNAAAKAFVEETQKPGQKNPTSAVLLGSETTEVRIPKEQSTGVKKSTSNGSWHVVTPSGSPEEKRKETENETENEKQNETETETSERSGSASGTGGWFSSFAGIDPLASFSGSFVSASPETAARNEKSVAETTERAGSEQEKNAAWGLSLPEILAAPPSNSGATGVWPQFPDPGLVLVAAATADETQLKALDLAVRYRRVLSSERANDIAEKHLRLNKLTLETQRLNLNVLSENNSIHVDANVLAQQKLEGDTVDRRTALDTKKHAETLAFIADAFYTGLTVVFVVTLAGGWRRAVAALTATVR